MIMKFGRVLFVKPCKRKILKNMERTSERRNVVVGLKDEMVARYTVVTLALVKIDML